MSRKKLTGARGRATKMPRVKKGTWKTVPAKGDLITKGWMLKGMDITWLGWRIHANQGENMEPVRIVRGHG